MAFMAHLKGTSVANFKHSLLRVLRVVVFVLRSGVDPVDEGWFPTKHLHYATDCLSNFDPLDSYRDGVGKLV